MCRSASELRGPWSQSVSGSGFGRVGSCCRRTCQCVGPSRRGTGRLGPQPWQPWQLPNHESSSGAGRSQRHHQVYVPVDATFASLQRSPLLHAQAQERVPAPLSAKSAALLERPRQAARTSSGPARGGTPCPHEFSVNMDDAYLSDSFPLWKGRTGTSSGKQRDKGW